MIMTVLLISSDIIMHVFPQHFNNSLFLNDEMLEISMAAEISNLTQTIDIHYVNVDKVKVMTDE